LSFIQIINRILQKLICSVSEITYSGLNIFTRYRTVNANTIHLEPLATS